jgi:hypothetical protein
MLSTVINTAVVIKGIIDILRFFKTSIHVDLAIKIVKDDRSPPMYEDVISINDIKK